MCDVPGELAATRHLLSVHMFIWYLISVLQLDIPYHAVSTVDL